MGTLWVGVWSAISRTELHCSFARHLSSSAISSGLTRSRILVACKVWSVKFLISSKHSWKYILMFLGNGSTRSKWLQSILIKLGENIILNNIKIRWSRSRPLNLHQHNIMIFVLCFDCIWFTLSSYKLWRYLRISASAAKIQWLANVDNLIPNYWPQNIK